VRTLLVVKLLEASNILEEQEAMSSSLHMPDAIVLAPCGCFYQMCALWLLEALGAAIILEDKRRLVYYFVGCMTLKCKA
jgi:hypothetical protein